MNLKAREFAQRYSGRKQNPKDVNPYDSKAYKRTLKKKLKIKSIPKK